MKKEIIKNELQNLLKEDLSSLKINKMAHLYSCNRKLWKQLKLKYPNSLISLKHLIEIAKNKNNLDDCLKLYFCECGNEKVLTSKFCSNPNCHAKNKSVAKNCFLTKLKNHGCGTYNNAKKNAETCMKRYGVKNIFQSLDPKLNGKKTKLEKYGSEIYTNREKAKLTCLKKYGKENYMSTDEFKHKSKEYFQKHYGKNYFYETEDFQNKRRKTCLDKYGVDSFSKTTLFKEKYESSNNKKFGVSYPAQSKEIINKMKNTCLNNYGVDSFSKTRQFKDLFKNKEFIKNIKKKEYITKKKNNSTNTSAPENEMESILKNKFPDIIHTYMSELYPFECDFYIPSKDLYIEAHLGWTHNFKAFDNSNPEHLKELEFLKQKAVSSNYYKNKIYTWTDLDVRKAKIAKMNNLNWLVFYKFEDFLDWFENQ